MKNILIVFCLIYFFCDAIGQTTMMPIPFSKKGEDKRLLIEDDPCFRIIETKIKNAFLEEADYQLIDYLTALNNLDATDILTSQGKYDIVTLLIQSANPDIYFLLDIEQFSKTGTTNRQEYSMTINLTAKWTHDGKFIGGAILNSGWRYYEGCFELVEKCFQNKNDNGEKKINAFVNKVVDRLKSLNPESDSIKSPHQSISIEFYLSHNIPYDYFSQLNTGELLFKCLSDWIKEHSIDNKADSNFDRNYLKFQEIKIPVYLDDSNKLYSTSDFTVDFLEYFSQLAFQDAPGKKLMFMPTGAGNSITFTLH